MIIRRNVLDLIGKQKYQSCIITCYSFDFIFFEQRVLPKLRMSGILDVSVFVDAKMYQIQLAQLDGRYISKQSYSIIPVELNGAFHPKILMAFGKKQGFLAIGSGNLTNSGLSSNDEVWNAFHTSDKAGKAYELFNETYNYLNNLKAFCYGSSNEKWSWIENGAQWLNYKNKQQKDRIILGQESYKLVSSFADSSILDEIINEFPNSNPKKITIISPYYNKDGILITSLSERLKPEKINVVVDKTFGTVPYQIKKTDNISFYEWQQVRENGNKKKEIVRLHAKIIQFEFDNKTYFLSGSSNATMEAFGSISKNTRNAESNILISSEKKRDWIKELEINISENSKCEISSFNNDEKVADKTEFKSYEIKLLKSEVDEHQLIIYSKEVQNIYNDYQVEIERINGEKSYYKSFQKSENRISLFVNEEEAKGFRVCLVDDKKNRVSTFSKIVNKQLILRTNPDAKSVKIFEILNGTELKDSDLEQLLEFANFDNHIIYNSVSKGQVSEKKIQNDVELNEEYKELSEDEFNQNENIVENKQNNNRRNLTLLEEFLNQMTFGESKNRDFEDSQERMAEQAGDEGLSNSDVEVGKEIKLSFTEGQKLKNVLHRTLNRVNSAIQIKRKGLIENIISRNPIIQIPSVDDIKGLLVGTHLIFMKINERFIEERLRMIIEHGDVEDLRKLEDAKKFKKSLERSEFKKLEYKQIAYSIDANLKESAIKDIRGSKNINLKYIDETPSIFKEHFYFKFSPIIINKKIINESIKGFLINTVAPFLLFISNEKLCDFNESEKARYDSFKARLFYRTLLLILASPWKNQELEIMRLLLLNTIHFLKPKDQIDSIIEKAKILNNKLKSPLNIIEENKFYSQKTIDAYLKWIKIYNEDKTKLVTDLGRGVGKTIFKNNLGFVKIMGVFENKLNLTTPLGSYNPESKKFEIRNVISGKSILEF